MGHHAVHPVPVPVAVHAAPVVAAHHAVVEAPAVVAAAHHGGFAYGFGTHHIGKRSADADPALLYGHHGLALPLAHHAPVLPVAHAVAHHPVVKSVVETPAEVTEEVTAHHVPIAVGYHGYGHYYGKSSADAEPAVLAGHTRIVSAPTPLIHNPPLLHHAVHPVPVPVAVHAAPVVAAHHAVVEAPAVVAAAPLAVAAHHGGFAYGFGTHHIGKRSADADPALVYG